MKGGDNIWMHVRYLDCRQPLYARFIFVFHRVETALQFLSIPAIAPEITSLQLSLQLDIRRGLRDGVETLPNLPWHGSASAWQQLRDHLSKLENLRRPDVWLDAADQLSRCSLIINKEAFNFDARLVAFMRVSVPWSAIKVGYTTR